MTDAAQKLDAALKAKWIEALRSGDYEQARGTLYDGEGYCCLGVLCKVAGLTINSDGDGIVGMPIGEHEAYRPIYDLVGGIDRSHSLSMRNDGLDDYPKHSFDEMASFIERNF